MFNYLNDSYEHLDETIEYLPESLKCTELENVASYEFSGCSCSTSCLPESCTCIERSGAKYLYNSQKLLSSYTIQETDARKPIYECNSNCKCTGTRCGNRLVQCGPRRHLKITEAGDKGLSLITTKCISSGNFICEYAGRIITTEMAKFLHPIYKDKYSMNFIFCINEQFGETLYKTIIDPTESGNIGRYINHSCEPNTKLYTIRINDETPKLCVFSNKSIGENEEICFNYGDSMLGDKTTSNLTPCLCRSSKCMKQLPFDENCFESNESLEPS